MPLYFERQRVAFLWGAGRGCDPYPKVVRDGHRQIVVLDATIPTELGLLTYLQVLDLSGNRLTGTIPEALASLTNLQELRLSGNYQLTGCIPGGLEDVASNDLEGLDLRSCSDPTGDCANDGAVMDAANNPGLVSDCTALLAVRDTLAENAPLNWSADLAIERWVGVEVSSSPRRVTSLSLRERHLSGTIPVELGNLTNLKRIDLFGNQLTGSIPEELGDLTNLEFLSLFDNHLTGSIPKELGSLTNLKWMNLGENQLTGTIPEELGNLKSLNLYDNQLTGTLPAVLGNLTNLKRIYLFDNQLTGMIPEELGDLTNLNADYRCWQTTRSPGALRLAAETRPARADCCYPFPLLERVLDPRFHP